MRNILGPSIIVVALALISPAVAIAESPPKLGYLAEDASGDSVACGVTNDGIKATTLAAMRYNRVSLSNDADLPMVYVHSLTFKLGTGLCVTSYGLSVRQFDYANVHGIDATRFARTVFCERYGMVSYPPYEGATKIDAAIKRAFELCLADLDQS